jgi:membrane protein
MGAWGKLCPYHSATASELARALQPSHAMQVTRLIRELARHFVEDEVQNVGAMLAFFAVMALFPMLGFVLSLALVVVDPSAVREGLGMASETMPAGVHDMLAQRVDALVRASGARFAVLGAALALWGASRGAMALMTALNRTYRKQETRSWLRREVTAILVTVGVAGLVVLALSLLIVGPEIGRWVAHRSSLGGAFDVAWGVARWVGAGLLVMLVWAITYRFLPNTDAPFRIFTPGAIAGVVIWLAISWLFGLYVGHFQSYEATYGTLGGAIIFLIWLWLSNIALLVGAEINDILAEARKGETRPAELANPNEHVHEGAPAHS